MQRAYPRPCRAWHDRRSPRQCVLLQNGVQRLVGWMKVPQTTCLLCRKLAPTSRTPLFTRCIDCSDGFGSVYRHQRSELCLSLFVRVCVSVRAYLHVFFISLFPAAAAGVIYLYSGVPDGNICNLFCFCSHFTSNGVSACSLDSVSPRARAFVCNCAVCGDGNGYGEATIWIRFEGFA